MSPGENAEITGNNGIYSYLFSHLHAKVFSFFQPLSLSASASFSTRLKQDAVFIPSTASGNHKHNQQNLRTNKTPVTFQFHNVLVGLMKNASSRFTITVTNSTEFHVVKC